MKLKLIKVGDLISHKELFYLDKKENESFHPSIKKLYQCGEYKEEKWSKIFRSVFGEPVFDINGWVLRLHLDHEKMIKDRVEMTDITNAVKKVYDENNFFMVYSPLEIGIIDVFINFEVPTKGIEIESGGIITPENIRYFYTRDIVYESIASIKISGVDGILDLIYVDDYAVTEGSNLIEILGLDGIDKINTMSNDVWQIDKTLGIEAARAFLVEEFKNILCSGGSYINDRHIMLLVEEMTRTGIPTAVHRGGIDREEVGPIGTAAFETCLQNLTTSAIFTEEDDLRNVSSRVAMGMPILGGTGSVNIYNEEF